MKAWPFPRYKVHLPGPVLSSAKNPLRTEVVVPAAILCSALRDLQKPDVRVGKND